MCSSGVGFNPVAGGTHYTFDIAGLYNGLFVMSDRQTGSVWTHYDGTVLTGPLAGTETRLRIEPMVQTRWADWSTLHPETLVLDWYPEFSNEYHPGASPGGGGIGPQFRTTLLHSDARLPENQLVLGAALGSEHRAFVLEDLPAGLSVIADELNGLPVVVFGERENSYALAFHPVVEGHLLQFSVEGDEIIDSTDSRWDLNGRATAGPLAGSRLPFVTSFVTEWYGWVAYHPQTSIYGR